MKPLILSALVILLSISVFVQKIKLIEGDLAPLKGQKSYAIRFVYDNMKVGRSIDEKQYLDEKKTEWEAREQGKGVEFVEKWFTNRKKMYEPAFVKNFEKYSYLS